MVLITNEEKKKKKIPHHNKTNSNYYLDKVQYNLKKKSYLQITNYLKVIFN